MRRFGTAQGILSALRIRNVAGQRRRQCLEPHRLPATPDRPASTGSTSASARCRTRLPGVLVRGAQSWLRDDGRRRSVAGTRSQAWNVPGGPIITGALASCLDNPNSSVLGTQSDIASCVTAEPAQQWTLLQ